MSEPVHPLQEPTTTDVRVVVVLWCNQTILPYSVSFLVPPTELSQLMCAVIPVLLDPRTQEPRITEYQRALQCLPFNNGPRIDWPRTPRLVTLHYSVPSRSPDLTLAYANEPSGPVTERELTDSTWWDAFFAYHELRAVL